MTVVTAKKPDQSIENIIRSLRDDCILGLEKLARTCCVTERSARMQVLKEKFAILDVGLASGHTSESINFNIASVEKCGEAIGGLFATCCTPTREKLYVQLMKNLGSIHTELWKLKGFSH